MITGAAFCPHPPLLVPAVAAGAAPELDELRAACRSAIREVARPGTPFLVLGTGPRTEFHPSGARGSLHGYGVDLAVTLGRAAEAGGPLPLSLTVGAWLLHDSLGDGVDASGWSIGPEWAPVDHPDTSVALLVMGDGSARRSRSAPGYLDDRAAAYDAEVAAALASGDPGRLRVDVELGDQLLAAGPRAWAAAGELLGGRRWSAEVTYDAAPYGVGYFAAVWRPA